MKRRAMCVVCLILYILAACTCLSLKIEEEMRLEADGMTVKGLGMWGQNIEIPMTALFEDAYGYHLYEVVEGTGWESGLRVGEVSPQRYAVDFINQTVRHSGGEDHLFITSASRQPTPGELVEIIEAQTASDRWLIYDPSTGEMTSVEMEEGQIPFFEHRAAGQLQKMGCRIFSTNAVESFTGQLPMVYGIAAIILATVILWLIAAIFCEHAKLGVNIAISLVSLAAVCILLSKLDLPAAMLPTGKILDLGHYQSELALFQFIESSLKIG